MPPTSPLSRRRLLGGLGAVTLAAAAGRGRALAAARAPGIVALLLNCIDYRLASAVTRYMGARGLSGNYDQLALAGASLAAVHPGLPAWNQTFWDHVQVAIDLHGIGSVIVLDPRDCGAFATYLGRDYAPDPAAETEVHAVYLDTLRQQLAARHPGLGVELLLMSLDGSVADLT